MTGPEKKATGAVETPQAAEENLQTDFNDKRLQTLVAQMSLAGHQVHRLEQGFLVSRWGMTKVCPDYASLVKFSRQIGCQ